MTDKIMRDDPNEMTRDCLFILQVFDRGAREWIVNARHAVWFTREEAESYASSRHHELGELNGDWRVYGVCANGALADIIAQHTKSLQ